MMLTQLGVLLWELQVCIWFWKWFDSQMDLILEIENYPNFIYSSEIRRIWRIKMKLWKDHEWAPTRTHDLNISTGKSDRPSEYIYVFIPTYFQREILSYTIATTRFDRVLHSEQTSWFEYRFIISKTTFWKFLGTILPNIYITWDFAHSFIAQHLHVQWKTIRRTTLVKVHSRTWPIWTSPKWRRWRIRTPRRRKRTISWTSLEMDNSQKRYLINSQPM